MDLFCVSRRDVLSYLRRVGLVRCRGPGDLNDLNRNSKRIGSIKAALVAGCYPRLLRIDKKNKRLVGE